MEGLHRLLLSTPDDVRAVLGVIRQRTSRPINLNFFTHVPPDFDAAREARWKECLAPFYAEHGLNPDQPAPRSNRAPFTAETCAIVEEFKPEVVSFHFGLPHEPLLERVKRAGSKVIASATTATFRSS